MREDDLIYFGDADVPKQKKIVVAFCEEDTCFSAIPDAEKKFLIITKFMTYDRSMEICPKCYHFLVWHRLSQEEFKIKSKPMKKRFVQIVSRDLKNNEKRKENREYQLDGNQYCFSFLNKGDEENGKITRSRKENRITNSSGRRSSSAASRAKDSVRRRSKTRTPVLIQRQKTKSRQRTRRSKKNR